MSQAKSSLSRLVQAIERGDASEIVIARNGRASARLVPVDSAPVGKRIDSDKGEVVRLFLG
jgi:antitoxin (DNA-binding transcriptional repressor) of toxin-antitoxin stability system